MKRAGQLYERIPDWENLMLAFWKAQEGKRGKRDVQAFSADLEVELGALREELLIGRVSVGDYHYFTIRDPKERRICAASFRERVLHHAIMNVCEPVFERYLIHDSYACRPGKGMHRAVRRAQTFMRRFPWCLKLDVAAYFDSIDQNVLKGLLARRFKDPELLALFDAIIDSYETAAGKGLPIGNLTSQHFANHYLGVLDHVVKERWRIKGYVRYMDDLLVWGDSREGLRCALRELRHVAAERLQLSFKEDAQLKRSRDGVSFLGMRVFPKTIRLTRRSRQRFVRKFRWSEREYLNGNLTKEELARRVGSLVEYTRLADARAFRQTVIDRFGAVS